MKFFKFKKKNKVNKSDSSSSKPSVEVNDKGSHKTPPQPKQSKTRVYYSKNSKTVPTNNSKYTPNNYKNDVYFSKKYDAYHEQMMMLQYWRSFTKESDRVAKVMREKREPEKPKAPVIVPVIF